MHATTLLGEMEDYRAVEPLINSLKKSPDMAANTMWALSNITGQDFGKDPKKWQNYTYSLNKKNG